jgi:prepilin-type N-terminal cleavage/methylation domain-containing protein
MSVRVRGTTLIEVIVAVAIIGLLAALSAVQLRSPSSAPSSASDEGRDEMTAALDSAAVLRERALRSHRMQRTVVMLDGRSWLVSAFPDGSVFTDADLPFDRLTGERYHAAR